MVTLLVACEKSTSRLPVLVGESVSVVIDVPLFDHWLTKDIDAADTCVAHDAKISWVALLGLVPRHKPAVGVLLGRVKV